MHEVGIVLSGGGARGVAHIGVLRALRDRGIHPGCIAGTSAGAIVGALYAAGYDPSEMLEFFVEKNPFRISKVAVTRPGIIDSSKSVADFEEYFPSDSFDALDRELHVVATDLTNGERVEFSSGPLIRAVLASSSFPVLFTPMVVNDRVLADGGIVDNFPVALIEGRCRTLLGVHVSPMRAWDREEFKHAFALLRRSMEVAMYRASEPKFERCDVVVRPAGLDEFGIFDSKSFSKIEQIGHDAAMDEMTSIEDAIERARR